MSIEEGHKHTHTHILELEYVREYVRLSDGALWMAKWHAVYDVDKYGSRVDVSVKRERERERDMILFANITNTHTHTSRPSCL